MPPAPTMQQIQPSAAVRAWYRTKLQVQARAMAQEALAIVKKYSAPAVAEPFANGPSPSPHSPEASDRDEDPGQAAAGAAFDAAAADVVALKQALADWGVRWEQRLDRMAADIAKLFATRSGRYLEAAFRRKLRDAGLTVRFQPSPRMLEAHRSVVAENVGLIRSIPRELHQQVVTAVSKAALAGGDQRELSKEVRDRYGVSYRRASLIARDQSAKSRAVFESARRADLGITEAEWVHSHAGKVPRPEHVKWGRERRRFDVTKGLWSEVDKEWQLPGTAINCRCVSRSIIPDGLVRSSERAGARRGKAQDVRPSQHPAPAAR